MCFDLGTPFLQSGITQFKAQFKQSAFDKAKVNEDKGTYFYPQLFFIEIR